MVIVTGASGHIGYVLILMLVQEGAQVRALVLPGEEVPLLQKLPVEIVRGDVTDYSSLVAAFEGVDRVYHLAGVVSIGSGKKGLLQRVNVEGTQNVIKACIAKYVKRLVYVSSIHAFTEPPKGRIITETFDFNPDKVVGNYGKSKARATLAVLDAVTNGLDAVILHPTGVIGPYDTSSHMGQLVRDYMKGKLYAYIEGSYDFVDVRDVARGIILAGDKGRTGENYILSGEQISVKQILICLEVETGVKTPRFLIPLWFARGTALFAELYYLILRQKPLYTSYSIHTLCSNSLTTYGKAASELGYRPRSIHETIRDTVEWVRNAPKG